MGVVLDANALVVLALDRRRAAAVELRLTEWLDQGEDLHARVLLRYEIANVWHVLSLPDRCFRSGRAKLESAHESSAFGRREA